MLAEVTGTLWSTICDPGFKGKKLTLVAPLGSSESKILAVDLVGSRVGDKVLVVYEGSSSRLALEDAKTPCEAIIVGLIDQMSGVE